MKQFVGCRSLTIYDERADYREMLIGRRIIDRLAYSNKINLTRGEIERAAPETICLDVFARIEATAACRARLRR